MADLKPLVFVSGQVSELPPGDSVASASYGTVTTGSGLYSTGDVSSALEVGVVLNPAPSGLILTGDALGVDGVSLASSQAALSSGVFAQNTSLVALASGDAAATTSAVALASGNAALTQLASLGAGVFLDVTAAAAVASGTPVGFDSSGRVQPLRALSSVDTVSLIPTDGTLSSAVFSSYVSCSYDPVNNKYFLAYYDSVTSYLTGVVVTKTTNGFTFGSPSTIVTATCTFIQSVYDPSTGRIGVFYSNNNNSNYVTGIVITISGTSFTKGGESTISSEFLNPSADVCYHTAQSKIVLVYGALSPSQTVKYAIITISGTIIGSISVTDISPGGRGYVSIVYNSSNNIIVLSIILVNQTTNDIRAGTLSGTTITFGTPVSFGTGSSNVYPALTNAGNLAIITWMDSSSGPNLAKSRVASFSGTTVTLNTTVTASLDYTAGYYFSNNLYFSASSRYVSIGIRSNNQLWAQVFQLSGTTLTQVNSLLLVRYTSGASLVSHHPQSNTVDPTFVIPWVGSNNSYLAAVTSGFIYTPTYNSMNNYLGVAQTTVASGDPLSVRLPGTFDSNFSNLTPGAVYYLNPSASGFSTAPSIAATWSGAANLDRNSPVGIALSPSVMLLSDTV